MARLAVPNSLAFVDTNVLVYAFDLADPEKHAAVDAPTDVCTSRDRQNR